MSSQKHPFTAEEFAETFFEGDKYYKGEQRKIKAKLLAYAIQEHFVNRIQDAEKEARRAALLEAASLVCPLCKEGKSVTPGLRGGFDHWIEPIRHGCLASAIHALLAQEQERAQGVVVQPAYDSRQAGDVWWMCRVCAAVCQNDRERHQGHMHDWEQVEVVAKKRAQGEGGGQ